MRGFRATTIRCVAWHVELLRPEQFVAQALPLARANWSETGWPFEFAPNTELYDKLHALGLWFAVGAFAGAELTGYCTALVAPSGFNAHVRVCTVEALYVRPTSRGGSAAARLKRALEAEAAARGAQHVLWHAPVGSAWAETLQRRGYLPRDIVLTRRLHV